MAAGPGDNDPDPTRPRLPPLTGSPYVTPGVGKLGMIILLVSLSMLFIASMIGYLWVRLRATQWPPSGVAPLPGGLWVSTALLLVSSGTIHAALRNMLHGQRDRSAGWLLVTFILGIEFLVLQLVNWAHLASRQITPRVNLYGFTFYVLTGLHGLHVIGGLIPLGIVTRRARRGWYSQEHHPGIEYCAMYWHFLDVVWLCLFTMLVILA